MIRKMPKKPATICILLCAFAAMLLIDLFSLHVSTIVLLLAAAGVSLIVCLVKRQKGKGAEK
jgi:chromate transporter